MSIGRASDEDRGRRPVVIVGAGPTGVTAALLLSRYNIPTVVLDRWTSIYARPRAVHLDDEVHRILGRLGVGDEFSAISRPARGLRLVDRDLRVLAEFARDDAAGVHGYPQANMFDQPALEGLLRARMRRTPLISFRGNVEVVAVQPVQDWTGPLLVHFDDVESGNRQVIEADHVLGCDGANSVVRQSMGSRMIDLGFEQRWLVIDVETDADIRQWDGVHQVCDRRRAATYMRIGQRRYRWEFRLLDGESLSDFESMSDIHPLIAPWTQGTPPQQLRLIRIADYVFRAQMADHWRRGGAFLLGDAAHLTPPFIGQGMGAGLRDANNLAWKLAGVVHGALEPTALDSYEVERRPHARAMISTAIGMGLAMTGGGAVGEALRGLVFPHAHLLPGLRRLIVDSVSPRLGRSSLLARRGPVRSSALVGTLAPNALLRTGERLDSVAHGYVLVTRSVPSRFLAAELARRRIVTVTAVDDEPLGAWLRRSGTVAALVRPDFTVAMAGSDPERMVAHLPGLASDAGRRPGAVAWSAGLDARLMPPRCIPATRVQYCSELMTLDTQGKADGTPRGAANRLDRRKARTRAALIEAAQAMLAEGRTNAPVNVITEAADLGTGSFYNHFDTKEQLFEAAVIDALERHAAYVEVLTSGLDDPAAVFAQSYRLTGRLHRQQPMLSKVVLGDGLRILNSADGLAPRARRDIQAAAAAGRFRVSDLDVAMITVIGAALCLGQMIHDRPEADDAGLTDQVTADVLRVLGMSAQEAQELAFAPLQTRLA